jgi:hypothetical protein
MECAPEHAGRQLKCPACTHKITIPSLGGGKLPPVNYQAGDQTWTGDLPAPDVSTPTRYQAQQKKKSPPAS